MCPVQLHPRALVGLERMLAQEKGRFAEQKKTAVEMIERAIDGLRRLGARDSQDAFRELASEYERIFLEVRAIDVDAPSSPERCTAAAVALRRLLERLTPLERRVRDSIAELSADGAEQTPAREGGGAIGSP